MISDKMTEFPSVENTDLPKWKIIIATALGNGMEWYSIQGAHR